MRDATRAVGMMVLAATLACAGGGGGRAAAGGGRPMPGANRWVVPPVEAYGKLQVCGDRICSASGRPVQLRGMSLFWSNTGWGGDRFYDAGLVKNLADQWNATVIRVAVGAQDPGNVNVDPSNLARARVVIDAAIARGMYVIVDWHSHGDRAASLARMTEQARAFFGTLAREYAGKPHLIWEPFNEPPGDAYGWPALKAYHEAVVATIRAAGSTNLVVAGSPFWSQYVDVAAADPVKDPAHNVAYTLHFYAHSHGAALRARAEAAMGRGAAIFVTEYGTCDASGNGGFDPVATQAWLDWMDQHRISSANWAMNSKAETASALLPGATTAGPWRADELTDSGWLVMPYVHRGYGFDLRVERAGGAEGTVTSTPAGIACGPTCAVDFTAQTAITLSAVPAAGAVFGGWSGACAGTGACVVTMDAARDVTATFARAP